MTAFDYAVLVIVGASVLLSVMRGAVREILALLSWVAALWVAYVYTMQLAPMLPANIPSQSLRLLAAFVILFLGSLLIMSLISIALSQFVKALGLGPLDRVLGAVFGLARGVLIALVVVLAAGLTSVPHQDYWKNAMFSPPLEAVVQSARPWLPEDFSRRISYD